MLTMRVVIKNTPHEIRQRAPKLKAYWRVKGQDKVDKAGKAYRLYKMHCRPPRSNKTPQIFTQWCRVYPPDRGTSPDLQRVWVRCSCEYFLYYLEVAMAYHKSSAIKYSNGMMPTTTNPTLHPYLCKHLYRLLTAILLAQKNEQRVAGKPSGKKPPKPARKIARSSLSLAGPARESRVSDMMTELLEKRDEYIAGLHR